MVVFREGESRILVVFGLGVGSEVEALRSALLKNLDMVVGVGCTRQSLKTGDEQSPKDTRELLVIEDASWRKGHGQGEKFARNCKVEL